VLEFLSELSHWFSRVRQSDRTMIVAAELCFQILGLDPFNNAKADCLTIEKKVGQPILYSFERNDVTNGSSKLSSLLVSLNVVSISLLRSIFEKGTELRITVLNDFFHSFAQVCRHSSQ
jgi:hypothetical protein